MKLLVWLIPFLLYGSELLSQEIPVLDFQGLEERIREKNEAEVLVVNFWATWCKPCIKELPYFDSLQTSYSPTKVKVLLVSLDMEAKAAAKYYQRKNIQSEVVFLDAVDHNAWIDRISPDWSGAIPATLFINSSGEESFHEGEYSAEALFTQVNQLLNPN
ncbi:MAG: TlpA disulfide reductase family protein [Cyclobacteriaceae bacterium]